MSFETNYDDFIQFHLTRRSGERRGRLERGHREAEKLFCRNVWFPAIGQFNDLHPEFEVMDWRGLSYFCDFAYLSRSERIIFEIKGFGPHVKDMDRKKYCNELNRETFLTAMGYKVISFAYDDVAHRPDLCITFLRMLLHQYDKCDLIPMNEVLHKEIIRLAASLARPLRPVDIKNYLAVNHRTIVKTLQLLCDKRIFKAEYGRSGKYIVRYHLLQLPLEQLT